MLLRVILLFMLFAGGCWVFLSTFRHITGKQWLKVGAILTKLAICAIFAATAMTTIALLQHATN